MIRGVVLGLTTFLWMSPISSSVQQPNIEVVNSSPLYLQVVSDNQTDKLSQFDLKIDGQPLDYKQNIKPVKLVKNVNPDINLALVGLADQGMLVDLNIVLLDNDLSLSYYSPGYDYSKLGAVNGQQLIKTMADSSEFASYVIEKHRLPTADEIELDGVVSYQQFTDLFSNVEFSTNQLNLLELD